MPHQHLAFCRRHTCGIGLGGGIDTHSLLHKGLQEWQVCDSVECDILLVRNCCAGLFRQFGISFRTLEEVKE